MMRSGFVMKKLVLSSVVAVSILFAAASFFLSGAENSSDAGQVFDDDRAGNMDNSRHNALQNINYLKISNTISDLMKHPAFDGFAPHLLTKDQDVNEQSLRLSDVATLLPYHGYVRPDVVVGSLNRMICDASEGKKIFYDFYTDQQKQENTTKNSTGLFFFRGKPGAPFAVICPGGGFSYVGSFHEGFPYATELSKAGYNAFVLRYRVNGGGAVATEDLATAISFIFANADSLGISRKNYSLWGSSAGARMVAYIGSGGTAVFGGDNLPKPAVVVMAYTGHRSFTKDDPPTFAVVSENDHIVNASVVEKRANAMMRAGIDVEFHKYQRAGHGFGLGTGTDAEGWIAYAIRFWEKHLK